MRRRFNRWNGAVNLPKEQKLDFDLTSIRIAKHHKVPLEEKTVLIKCLGGKIHKIHMRFPGCITLLSHPDMKGEQTMMKLGGEKPECLKFLEQWKDSPASCSINRPIVQRHLAARQDWRSFRKTEEQSFTDEMTRPLYDRLRDRVAALTTDLFAKIAKQFKDTQQGQRYYNGWRDASEMHAVTESEGRERFVKSTIKFSHKDLINH